MSEELIYSDTSPLGENRSSQELGSGGGKGEEGRWLAAGQCGSKVRSATFYNQNQNKV